VQSPKIRAFVDFLVERLSFKADYMQMLCPNRQLMIDAADPCAALQADLAHAGREQMAVSAKIDDAEEKALVTI